MTPAQYDSRVSQVYCLFLVGALVHMVWFYQMVKDNTDVTYKDVALSLSPLVGAIIVGGLILWRAGKKLGQVPLIPVIGPGVL